MLEELRLDSSESVLEVVERVGDCVASDDRPSALNKALFALPELPDSPRALYSDCAVDDAPPLPRLTSDEVLLAVSSDSSALNNCVFELPAREVLALLPAPAAEELVSNDGSRLLIVPILMIYAAMLISEPTTPAAAPTGVLAPAILAIEAAELAKEPSELAALLVRLPPLLVLAALAKLVESVELWA